MKRAILVVLLLFGSSTAIAQDWWEDEVVEYPPIVLELNAWISQLDGTVQWGGGRTPGDEIDFRDDVFLDKSSAGPYVRLNIGMSDRWDLRFNFWHTRHDSMSELERDISFGGQNFAAGRETHTEFALDSYSVMVGYKLLEGEQLDFVLLGGVGVYRARMEMINEDDVMVERNSTMPTPLVGVALDLELTENLSLRAKATGMNLTIGGDGGTGYDAEAALKWTFYDGLYLTGGYKVFRADVEFETDIEGVMNTGCFTLEGPFFGLGLVF